MTDRGRRPAPRAKGKGPAAGKGRGSGAGKATTDGRSRRRRPHATSHRGRRVVAGLVVSVVLVAFLLVAVFPTRTWLSQRDETEARQAELERIRSEEQAHEERIDELETPEEIEQLARDQHGLVRPGEEAFQIAPPAVPPVDLPESWPFTGASDWLNR